MCPVLLLALLGCASMSDPKDAPQFTKAEVRVVLDRAGKVVNKTVVLDKPAQVGQLVRFFPELGTGRKSGTAGAWKARVIIQFTDDKGNTCKVATNYEMWNAPGQDDWELKRADQLEKFVEEITKE